MSLVGKPAPTFTAAAVLDGSNIKENFSLSEYIGKNYIVLFFYPADFTFVCPTELHAFQEKIQEFSKRGAVVIACSTDSVHSHYAWLNTSKNDGGIQGVKYPIVADVAKTVSLSYGVLAGEYYYDDEGCLQAEGPMMAFRGLFLIDKKGIVRHMLVNDMSIGRSVEESIRVLDALQHSETHGEVCPADWRKGAKAMSPTPQGVAEYLKD